MILNVYKPKGRSSFSVVAEIRRKLGVKKVGHAGTLDPLAEGVLIILTDKDTKRQSEFMHQEKEYIAEIGFGIYSESYDLEFTPKVTGTILLNDLKSKIEDVLKIFIGRNMQEVPLYSAVSVKGKRLYDLVRQGKVLEKAPSKEIEIYDIKLLDAFEKTIPAGVSEINVPTIKVIVRCSSGTYIRSLARDIGKAFELDAVMLSLVRTGIGEYKMKNSITIEQIKQ